MEVTQHPTMPPMSGDGPAVLQVQGISKIFPGVKALDNVSFDIHPGEVHALVGENGAGKSTLMKILAGNHRPNGGHILYQGEEVTFHNPLDAKAKGVLLIHQELSLVSDLSVAENIYLGSLPFRRLGRVDWRLLTDQTRRILDTMNCGFDAYDLVSDLSIAQQQMVEIARALAFKSTVVIFDEPTASLTDKEKTVLFENIQRLKQQGVAIVYISHRMNEIFEISDRITVLRDGKTRGTLLTHDTNHEDITKLMIGRTLDEYYQKSHGSLGKEVLRIENLTCLGAFYDISFSIRAGEVLGLYGLIGAGRSEVAEAIFGIRKFNQGQIYFEDKPQTIPSSDVAIALGIGYVPENRKEQGLVLGMSCRENMTLAQLDAFQSLGFMRPNEELKVYRSYKENLSISTTGPNQKVMNLSGGNQQKVVIAKWLSTSPKLLILDEPTRGIDVGSKSEIHKLIGSLAKRGYAVLVISSEMPEIMGISQRILTMHQGRVTAEFAGGDITEDNLIKGITGLTAVPNLHLNSNQALQHHQVRVLRS